MAAWSWLGFAVLSDVWEILGIESVPFEGILLVFEDIVVDVVSELAW